MEKNRVHIYTDGACSGNPGVGGYAAILRYGKTEKVLSGSEESTTNNRMELLAVIKALECLKRPVCVSIYTDSAYVLKAFEENWIINWKRNGWKTSTKKPVANQDLWCRLDALVQNHQVSWVKVKGHSDHEENNRCDALAVQEWKNLKKALAD